MKHLFTFLLLLTASVTFGQTPFVTVKATRTTICAGEPVVLSATGPANPAFQTSNTLNPVSNGQQPINCDCPAGYVAVGYKGRGGTWLDQIVLACKKFNPEDGTLDPGVVYTISAGGTGGKEQGPFLLSGNSALVGINLDKLVQGNNPNHAYDITGYGQPISKILAGDDSQANATELSSFKTGVAGNADAGTVYVPAGNVVTGLAVTPSPGKNGLIHVGSVAVRYVPIKDLYGPINVNWSDGQSGSSVTVKPGETTVYTATPTGANASLPPANITITVNALPTATVSGGGAVCEGATRPNVSIALTGTAPWTITYSNGATNTTISNIAASPYVISQAPAGTYTVSSVSDANCQNTGSGSATVTVNPLPQVSLNNGGGLTCAKTSTQLLATSSTANVSFSFAGPGAITSQNGGSASVSQPGQYTVTATASGCTSKATTDVTQNIAPPTGVSLSSNGTLSANTPTATLTASSNATANVGVSYEFSQPSQKISDNQARVTTSGTYSVTATRSDNGCTATATTNVLGAASVTACRNASATLSLAAAGSPVRYEWYVGVATGSALRDGQYYQGTATASLTVVRVTQSQVYYAKVFYADGSSVVYGPFRVTLNTNCAAREAATVEPGTELRITLLGNPLQGEALKALVQGAAGQRLHVELVDQSGRPVRSQMFESADPAQVVEWNLNSATSGLYMLQAVSGQQRYTAKVIKP